VIRVIWLLVELKLVLTPPLGSLQGCPRGGGHRRERQQIQSTRETLLDAAFLGTQDRRGLRKPARGGDPISQPENWGSTPIRAPSAIVPFCTPPQVTSFHTQLKTLYNTAAYMYRHTCCCYLSAGSLRFAGPSCSSSSP
jgi:hypothetical protein